ncbi:MAG: sodium:calcium antiporter [Candidatus Eisenbacteria sp.]|nr:sodium:calcium antiporter [Candidatus Eisenbacteria bacterium]
MEHLIPQSWFEPLATVWLLAITLASLAVLVKGADWLVAAAVGIAYRFGISKVIVGATVVSLGTTSPEAAVSVLAAWSGQSGLALGNAVGSICADTGLIFGLGCLLAVLPADRFVLQRQGWVQFGAALLLAGFCYVAFAMQGDQAALGRGVGAFFLVLLIIYLVVSVRWSRRHPAPAVAPVASVGLSETVEVAKGEDPGTSPSVPAGPAVAAAAAVEQQRAIPLLAGIGVAGLVLVIFASRVLICAVSEIAIRWGVPQVVIAATLVAIGTSLPELVVGITSIVKGHGEILVGNVIGADVLNVLFVIGASATAARLPIVELSAQVPRIFLYLHLPAMIVILLLFRIFIFSAVRRGEFRRWFGIPLVAIYVTYVVTQFLLST